jgi:hypothetical protein
MAFAPGVPNNQGGRKKGSKNRNPQKVISMILRSLDQVGGTKYLVRMADEQPVAFLGLLGKVLPKNVSLTADSEHHVIHHDSRDWLNNQILANAQRERIEEIVIEALPESEPQHDDNVVRLAPVDAALETYISSAVPENESE